MPERDPYLSSTGKNYLYDSRTNRLRKRLREHCSEGRTHLTAAFACRIARLETGHVRASYRKEVFRASLMGYEPFAAALRRAKRRLAGMDIRYVEEAEPVRQALFEMYVAVAFRTPFNKFDNQ